MGGGVGRESNFHVPVLGPGDVGFKGKIKSATVVEKDGVCWGPGKAVAREGQV